MNVKIPISRGALHRRIGRTLSRGQLAEGRGLKSNLLYSVVRRTRPRTARRIACHLGGVEQIIFSLVVSRSTCAPDALRLREQLCSKPQLQCGRQRSRVDTGVQVSPLQPQHWSSLRCGDQHQLRTAIYRFATLAIIRDQSAVAYQARLKMSPNCVASRRLITLFYG